MPQEKGDLLYVKNETFKRLEFREILFWLLFRNPQSEEKEGILKIV